MVDGWQRQDLSFNKRHWPRQDGERAGDGLVENGRRGGEMVNLGWGRRGEWWLVGGSRGRRWRKAGIGDWRRQIGGRRQFSRWTSLKGYGGK